MRRRVITVLALSGSLMALAQAAMATVVNIH